MNNIYSSYSFDNGKTWSDPRMDSESIKNKFIIYKFRTNNIEDLNQFKLNTTFGTNKMSFIGFKNIKKMG
jgi:Neuraminidase (sialidase)